jgi:hypothetical protein
MDMRQREITIPGIELPEGCRLLDYDGDFLLIGVGLNAGRYQNIKAGLSVDIQARLVGWQTVPVLHRYGGRHPALVTR